MNQNRISPEQVAQTTQTPQQRMTMEQLQKTQVLNLEDFKETTRIEKLSSQRPAKIVAMLGVMLIAMGILFPSFQSLTERGKTTNPTQTEFREQSKTVEKKQEKIIKDLSCRYEQLNLANGSDEIINAYYTFNDNKLTNSTKEFIIRKSAQSTEAEPAILKAYLDALQPFLAVQTTGYSIGVENIENGSITKSVVDYASLTYESIPAMIQENPRFSVPFKADTSYEDVKAGMEAQNYICE